MVDCVEVQSPPILPLSFVRFALKQTELQQFEDDMDYMSCVVRG
jgi:hypothetical protein